MREQQEWLEAQVAAGRFTSVEAAVRLAVDHFLMPVDTADLSWAKPYLDEARRSVARDEVVSLDEFNRHVDARLKELR